MRFFTPTTEVPICGRDDPAHYVLAREGAPVGRRPQRTAAVALAVDSELFDGEFRIWMHQQPGEIFPLLDDRAIGDLMAALRLTAEDLEPHSPVQIVSTGHSKVMVPLRRRAKLAALAPDLDALNRLTAGSAATATTLTPPMIPIRATSPKAACSRRRLAFRKIS